MPRPYRATPIVLSSNRSRPLADYGATNDFQNNQDPRPLSAGKKGDSLRRQFQLPLLGRRADPHHAAGAGRLCVGCGRQPLHRLPAGLWPGHPGACLSGGDAAGGCGDPERRPLCRHHARRDRTGRTLHPHDRHGKGAPVQHRHRGQHACAADRTGVYGAGEIYQVRRQLPRQLRLCHVQRAERQRRPVGAAPASTPAARHRGHAGGHPQLPDLVAVQRHCAPGASLSGTR